MPDPVTPTPSLAESLDAQLSPALEELTSLLQAVQQRQALTPLEAARAQSALARARQVAQLHARIARLPLVDSPQDLDLDQVLEDTLRSREQGVPQSARLEVRRHLQPVRVTADAQRLQALLATLLDWMTSQGRQALMKLSLRNWPEHGVLAVRIARPVHAPAQPGGSQQEATLWQLLQELAGAMDVALERQVSAEAVSLTLEFRRTVRPSRALSALDMEPGNGTVAPERARLMRGADVMLLSSDASVLRAVDQVCTRMGLRLTPVPNVLAALRFCERVVPSLMIVDEELHNESFDRLHADLVRRQGAMPLIEVGAAHEAFAISGWGEASASRVGRAELPERLPAAIALELGMAA